MMRLMKINVQINKKMIKMNKQKYFNVCFRYRRASWGVLGCLGVSWGNKTDPFQSASSSSVFTIEISPEARSVYFLFLLKIQELKKCLKF